MSQQGKFGTGGVPPASIVETLTGNSGGPVGPSGNNINIVGDGLTVDVIGDPLTHTLTISAFGEVALEFDTDDGTATPEAGVINIFGGANINTEGATDTVTINLDTSIVQPVTNSSGTEGLYSLGANRFMHNYGTNNTFLGSDAGNLTLTVANSIQNVGIGANALSILTDGDSNVAVGYNAGANIDVGSQNVAVGASALYTCDEGQTNIAVGVESSFLLTTGSDNISIGTRAGYAIDTGFKNICIGTDALNNIEDGVYNIAIGYLAGGALTLSDSNNIMIGHTGIIGDDNTIRIGETGTGDGQQDKCFIAGIENVDLNVSKVVTVTNDQLGSATLTAGSNVSIGTNTNAIVISANTQSQEVNYTTVLTASSPYNVQSTDYYISADAFGGPITILLPNAPAIGRIFVVKDKGGYASTDNITITTVGGVVTIDGSTSFVMNTDYQAVNLIFNGTSYEVY